MITRKKIESIITKVTLAVKLIDKLTPDKPIGRGEVSLKAIGQRRPAIYHPIGYFFLLNMPNKNITLIAGGGLYEEKRVIIKKLSNYPELRWGAKSSRHTLPLVEIELKGRR